MNEIQCKKGRIDGKLFTIWTYDLWGNDEDGFWVNDRYKQGELFIPNDILGADNKTLIEYLADKGCVRLSDDIDLNDIDINGESDYTLTFDFQGKPDFELQHEYDLYMEENDGVTSYYHMNGEHHSDE